MDVTYFDTHMKRWHRTESSIITKSFLLAPPTVMTRIAHLHKLFLDQPKMKNSLEKKTIMVNKKPLFHFPLQNQE